MVPLPDLTELALLDLLAECTPAELELFCGGPGSGVPGPCSQGGVAQAPDTSGPAVEAKRDSILQRAAAYPKALVEKAVSKVKEKYQQLEDRYGKKYALAIVGAGLAGAPLPLPGSSFLTAAPVLAIAEVHRQISARAFAEDELTPEQIQEIAEGFMLEIAEALAGDTEIEQQAEESDPAPASDQIATPGKDGERAESLLAASKKEGARVLADVTRKALKRWLARGTTVLHADRLLNDDERKQLAEKITEVNATANLLGRSRIRLRLQGYGETPGAFKFSDPTPFEVFDEAIDPMTPTVALDFFRRKVSLPGVTAKELTEQENKKAFTLAVNTDHIVLDRVKSSIQTILETGKQVNERSITQILADAGIQETVGGRKVDGAYAENVFRTNMMESYREGAQQELAEVADAFPVWRYVGIDDGRQRDWHKVHNDKYYPSSVEFTTVRDSIAGEFDGFQCRCILPWMMVQGDFKFASKSIYTGQAVELVTLSGKRLSVTVNHPVLTKQHGFIAASEVHQGDYLVNQQLSADGLSPGDDDQDRPAFADQVFNAFRQLDSLRVVKRWTGLDFHGEGLSLDAEVEIVGANRKLMQDFQAAIKHGGSKFPFIWTDAYLPFKSRLGSGDGLLSAVGRFRRSAKSYAHLLQAASQCNAVNLERFAQGVNRPASSVLRGNVIHWQGYRYRFRNAANVDAAFGQFSAKSVLLKPNKLSQRFGRLSGLVTGNDPIEIGNLLDRPEPYRIQLGAELLTARQHLFAHSGLAMSSCFSKFSQGFAGAISDGNLSPIRFLEPVGMTQPNGSISRTKQDTTTTEQLGKVRTADLSEVRDFMKRLAGVVEFDPVIEVRRFHYRGPAHDFQTTTGHYTVGVNRASRLVVANCDFIPIHYTEWNRLQAGGAMLDVSWLNSQRGFSEK